MKENDASKRKLSDELKTVASKAKDASGKALKRGTAIAGEAAIKAGKTTKRAVVAIQRTLGEDYFAILKDNPLVNDTLSRSDLLTENKHLLETVLNVPWRTSLMWGIASTSMLALKHPIVDAARTLHEVGHFRLYPDVDRWIDSATGSGHRLKFGHSLDFLPKVVEKFGVEGVPAFFLHISQDFFSHDGIPTMPRAWDAKKAMECAAGIKAKLATNLVSASFSSVLSVFSYVLIARELIKLAEASARKLRTRPHLENAINAIQSRDLSAAAASYKRALEIDRNPMIMMALGNVYMQRAKDRLRAYEAFREAMAMLDDNPVTTLPYCQATISARGLAGIHALATADVMDSVHPEFWNERLHEIVHATEHSFRKVAKRQARESEDLVPDILVTPALFSAAINYYLAATTSCYSPFIDKSRDMVTDNLGEALRCVGLMAQYDEKKLRPVAEKLRLLWIYELLPPDEIEAALATF